MIRNRRVCVALTSLLFVLGCAPQDASRVQPRLESEPQTTPAEQAALDEMLAKVDALLPGMAAPTIPERAAPQLAFEQLCFETSAPGKEAERAALSRAILLRCGSETPAPARVWMLRALAWLGRDEIVRGLAPLLSDDDPQIRELARRALEHNPSDEASAVLRSALRKAEDMDWRVALINALAARRDAASVPKLIELATARNNAVASAALHALGDVATPGACEALEQIHAHGDAKRRTLAGDALLRCAVQLRAQEADRAAATLTYLFDNSEVVSTRSGALRGLVTLRGHELRERLIDILVSPNEDPALVGVVADLLKDLPGNATTAALTAQLLKHTDAATLLPLIDVLGRRGDPEARTHLIVTLLRSEDDTVKIACLDALLHVSDDESAVMLARFAADTSGAVREKARQVLADLNAAGTDQRLLKGLRYVVPPARVELIVALGNRRVAEAVPALFDEALHADGAVRQAAFEALGKLATGQDAAELAALLPSAAPDAVQDAAVDAVVTACKQINDPRQRAQPVLDQWEDANDAQRVVLIRTLGRIGGPAALEQVRATLKYDDAAVLDAAVRALSEWDHVSAVSPLFDVARTSESRRHRILALRGALRLIIEARQFDSQTLVALFRDALALAERPEEKRQVLAGLSQVADLAALQLAQRFLDEPALQAEAQNAVIAIARLIASTNPEEATAAVQQVVDTAAHDRVQNAARAALEHIRAHEGYLTSWMIAGPYVWRGKDWRLVHKNSFFPEDPNRRATQNWQTLQPTNPTEPYLYDLTPFDRGGDRCVYVMTAIWSPQAQPARIDVGSDDSVKVWLNDELVHDNLVARGHQPFEDQVPVQLQDGWNHLMLKIVQGGGGWGFSCRIQAPEGGPLHGLKYRRTMPDEESTSDAAASE